jgi:hypothetical protein
MGGLLRCARDDGGGASVQKCTLELEAHHEERRARKNFFTIFVDGMFTTFIARLFTNASDALNEIRAMSCVLHVGHAD